MLRMITVAVTAAAAVALTAPPAAADSPSYDCRLRALQRDAATGRFQGVLVGVIAHADVSPVSIKCRVTVNAVTAGDTWTGAGIGFAHTEYDVSFAANPGDTVKVCSDYTSSHGSGTVCVTVGAIVMPPQVVYDTVDDVLGQMWPIIDPPICSVLKLFEGNYAGVVYINSQGDVFLYEQQYDCPPYDGTDAVQRTYTNRVTIY